MISHVYRATILESFSTAGLMAGLMVLTSRARATLCAAGQGIRIGVNTAAYVVRGIGAVSCRQIGSQG